MTKTQTKQEGVHNRKLYDTLQRAHQFSFDFTFIVFVQAFNTALHCTAVQLAALAMHKRELSSPVVDHEQNQQSDQRRRDVVEVEQGQPVDRVVVRGQRGALARLVPIL